jgi:hypothetical protein
MCFPRLQIFCFDFSYIEDLSELIWEIIIPQGITAIYRTDFRRRQ